ncbi:MAG TPA: hypothetical protein VN926_17480 [Bradyrhizobium sp.]|jgi:hypothetical protein|nr:hypothetical protein [Bradyrhizobium sp.]
MKGATSIEPNRVRRLTPREVGDVGFAGRRFPVVIIVSSLSKHYFFVVGGSVGFTFLTVKACFGAARRIGSAGTSGAGATASRIMGLIPRRLLIA